MAITKWSNSGLGAASTPAFSIASRLSNSSDILLPDIFRAAPPPSVACCAHQVQRCRGLWGLGFNKQIFGADKQVSGRGHSDKEGSALCLAEREGRTLPSIRSA